MSNVVFVTPHPAPLAAAHDLPTLWGGQQWTSRAVARAVLTTKMATLSPTPGAACCGARPPHSVGRSNMDVRGSSTGCAFYEQGIDLTPPPGAACCGARPPHSVGRSMMEVPGSSTGCAF